MRYFLKLSYLGASFHGWQIQPNAVSVQETVEKSLSTILRTAISITGAGRTDTGVNARIMYAHFDNGFIIDDKKKFLLSLNRLVGKNIFIEDILPVSNNAHARFDATLRTYKYFIGFDKNPFLNHLYWKSPTSLDVEEMNKAASLLLETKDFTSFAKLHSDVKTNICEVSEAEWKPIREDIEAIKFIGDPGNGIVFTISADRFLRNMVRAIVGTLVDVGRRKISVNTFKTIIESKDRCRAGTSMPPEALYLWNIIYPDSVI